MLLAIRDPEIFSSDVHVTHIPSILDHNVGVNFAHHRHTSVDICGCSRGSFIGLSRAPISHVGNPAQNHFDNWQQCYWPEVTPVRHSLPRNFLSSFRTENPLQKLQASNDNNRDDNRNPTARPKNHPSDSTTTPSKCSEDVRNAAQPPRGENALAWIVEEGRRHS